MTNQVDSVWREPSIRVMLMPKDTNGHGMIFGGAILSHLDIAGTVEARKHTTHRVVAVAIDKVEFIAPVQGATSFRSIRKRRESEIHP